MSVVVHFKQSILDGTALTAQHMKSAVDIWAAGCAMGELLLGVPLLCGESERDQLDKVSDTVSLHVCLHFINTLSSRIESPWK